MDTEGYCETPEVPRQLGYIYLRATGRADANICEV
jgi:hypothetical protein